MLKAVIFDIDGVLVDSRAANIRFYQNLLTHAGYPRPTEEEIMALFHLTMRQTVEQLSGATDQAEVERIFRIGAANAALRAPHLFKFPDRLEHLLESLNQRYRLAVVTSRVHAGVDDVFAAKDLRPYFDTIVAFEDYQNPKPHPEPLLTALARLRLNPDEAIYVGDSHSDIESANAAGMRSVHLSCAPHATATAAIVELPELAGVVERLAAA